MPKAKTLLKEQAIKLRTNGRSYKEIERALGVSRSSLSLWLRKIKLTEKQKLRLKNKVRINGMQLGRTTPDRWSTRRKRLLEETKRQYSGIRLSKRALALVGAALYWAEGNKHGKMRFSNADPEMIKLYLLWLRTILKVTDEDLVISVYAHTNVGITKREVVNYWSEITNIKAASIKLYSARVSRASASSRVGRLPYGTANIALHRSLFWRSHLAALLEKLGKDTRYAEQPQSYQLTKTIVP